jgi:hypothetical protein
MLVKISFPVLAPYELNFDDAPSNQTKQTQFETTQLTRNYMLKCIFVKVKSCKYIFPDTNNKLLINDVV